MRLAIQITLLAAALLVANTAAGQGRQTPDQPAVPPPPALTETHKRDILNYLDELKSVRKELELTQRWIIRDHEQDERDKQLALDRFKLLEDQRDRAKDEAQHYKLLYESLTKKRGTWCKVKRVLSLGISRCN